MNSEPLDTQFLQAVDRYRHLGRGQPVLGVPRIPHDPGPQLEVAPRVVAQADLFWDTAIFREKINVANVVEVDQDAQFACQTVLFCGRDVRGEHDVVPLEAHGIREQELRVRGAVNPTPLILEQLEDGGIRGCLDRKVLFEARVPRECLLQRIHVGADSRSIVEVERRRNLRNDLT